MKSNQHFFNRYILSRRTRPNPEVLSLSQTHSNDLSVEAISPLRANIYPTLIYPLDLQAQTFSASSKEPPVNIPVTDDFLNLAASDQECSMKVSGKCKEESMESKSVSSIPLEDPFFANLHSVLGLSEDVFKEAKNMAEVTLREYEENFGGETTPKVNFENLDRLISQIHASSSFLNQSSKSFRDIPTQLKKLSFELHVIFDNFYHLAKLTNNSGPFLDVYNKLMTSSYIIDRSYEELRQISLKISILSEKILYQSSLANSLMKNYAENDLSEIFLLLQLQEILLDFNHIQVKLIKLLRNQLITFRILNAEVELVRECYAQLRNMVNKSKNEVNQRIADISHLLQNIQNISLPSLEMIKIKEYHFHNISTKEFPYLKSSYVLGQRALDPASCAIHLFGDKEYNISKYLKCRKEECALNKTFPPVSTSDESATSPHGDDAKRIPPLVHPDDMPTNPLQPIKTFEGTEIPAATTSLSIRQLNKMKGQKTAQSSATHFAIPPSTIDLPIYFPATIRYSLKTTAEAEGSTKPARHLKGEIVTYGRLGLDSSQKITDLNARNFYPFESKGESKQTDSSAANVLGKQLPNADVELPEFGNMSTFTSPFSIRLNSMANDGLFLDAENYEKDVTLNRSHVLKNFTESKFNGHILNEDKQGQITDSTSSSRNDSYFPSNITDTEESDSYFAYEEAESTSNLYLEVDTITRPTVVNAYILNNVTGSELSSDQYSQIPVITSTELYFSGYVSTTALTDTHSINESTVKDSYSVYDKTGNISNKDIVDSSDSPSVNYVSDHEGQIMTSDLPKSYEMEDEKEEEEWKEGENEEEELAPSVYFSNTTTLNASTLIYETSTTIQKALVPPFQNVANAMIRVNDNLYKTRMFNIWNTHNNTQQSRSTTQLPFSLEVNERFGYFDQTNEKDDRTKFPEMKEQILEDLKKSGLTETENDFEDFKPYQNFNKEFIIEMLDALDMRDVLGLETDVTEPRINILNLTDVGRYDLQYDDSQREPQVRKQSEEEKQFYLEKFSPVSYKTYNAEEGDCDISEAQLNNCKITVYHHKRPSETDWNVSLICPCKMPTYEGTCPLRIKRGIAYIINICLLTGSY